MLRCLFDLLKETASKWSDDKASSRGAALAYYSISAIAPIIILAVSLAGLIYGADAASGKVAQQIGGTVGPQVAAAIESLVRNASNPSSSKWAFAIALVLGLFGAATVFIELQDALNTMWGVAPSARPFLHVLWERAFSFAMVLSAGVLLLGLLIVTAVLSAVARLLPSDVLPGGMWLWQLLNWLVSIAFVTLIFALIYKVVPDVHVPWRDVWAGAILASVLFAVGKYLLALYLTRTSVASAYGAAGSLVVVLVWVYYSAQILLFGAEFTRVEARRHGSTCEPMRSAVRMPLAA
jgi:membrane protein